MLLYFLSKYCFFVQIEGITEIYVFLLTLQVMMKISHWGEISLG